MLVLDGGRSSLRRKRTPTLVLDGGRGKMRRLMVSGIGRSKGKR